LRTVPLGPGRTCVVVDDALLDPQAAIDAAAAQRFEAPPYPYPGLVSEAPPSVTTRIADFFATQVRGHLGVRRTLDLTVRWSIVCTPEDRLDPRQWQCHRDRVTQEDGDILFAASVLYLFRDPALGGTSFYVPRQSAAETDRLQADSQTLDAAAFAARWGVRPGYMDGSNAYFERVARIPAQWNRMIFYDGGMFHSADVDAPDRLDADPRRGRLTLNSFFTCKRVAR
jgi:hypothetical protein